MFAKVSTLIRRFCFQKKLLSVKRVGGTHSLYHARRWKGLAFFLVVASSANPSTGNVVSDVVDRKGSD